MLQYGRTADQLQARLDLAGTVAREASKTKLPARLAMTHGRGDGRARQRDVMREAVSRLTDKSDGDRVLA